MCHPAGRGDGSIADDVYALGVLLLWCVLGGPASWAEPSGLLRRKLELGSLPALAAGSAVSGAFQELLRLMLAEDPDHHHESVDPRWAALSALTGEQAEHAEE